MIFFGNCCVLKSSGKRRLSAGFLQDEKVLWANEQRCWIQHIVWVWVQYGQPMATPNLQFEDDEKSLDFGMPYFQWLYIRQLSDMGLLHFLSTLTQAVVENPQKMECRYTRYTHYTMIMEMSSCQVARTKEPVEPLSVSWSKDNEPLSHWATTCRTWRLKSCCSPRSLGGLKRDVATCLSSQVWSVWSQNWNSFCRIPQDSVREQSAAQTSGKLWISEQWPTVTLTTTKLFVNYLTKYGWLVSSHTVPLPWV